MVKLKVSGDIALTGNEVFVKDFWNEEFFKIGEYAFDGGNLIFTPSRNERLGTTESYAIHATTPWDIEYLACGGEYLCAWQFGNYYIVGNELDTLDFYTYDDEHFAKLTDVDQYCYLCNKLTAGADPLADLWDGIQYDEEDEY